MAPCSTHIRMHRGFFRLVLRSTAFSSLNRLMFCHAAQRTAAFFSLIMLTAVLYAFPDASHSQTSTPGPAGVCRVCHARTALLTFISLGTKGSGVESVGGVYKVDGNVSGRVGAGRLLLRNEQGMRLSCEIGRYLPRGSEVVFGNKAYRMWKGGMEWNMRSVLSINGMPTGGNVFIAEYFVRKYFDRKIIYKIKSNSYHNIGVRANASAPTREHLQKLIDRSIKEDEDRKAQESKTTAPLPEPVQAPANKIVIKEERGAYKVTSYHGGLTIEHTFKGKSSITLHEAHLKTYPRISYQEVFSIPLDKVKENMFDYIRGFDGSLESNILALVHEELRQLFAGNAGLKLPEPDNRIITSLRVDGDAATKQLSLCLNSGTWVPATDDFLIKIIQSEPVPSFAGAHDK